MALRELLLVEGFGSGSPRHATETTIVLGEVSEAPGSPPDFQGLLFGEGELQRACGVYISTGAPWSPRLKWKECNIADTRLYRADMRSMGTYGSMEEAKKATGAMKECG